MKIKFTVEPCSKFRYFHNFNDLRNELTSIECGKLLIAYVPLYWTPLKYLLLTHSSPYRTFPLFILSIVFFVVIFIFTRKLQLSTSTQLVNSSAFKLLALYWTLAVCGVSSPRLCNLITMCECRWITRINCCKNIAYILLLCHELLIVYFIKIAIVLRSENRFCCCCCFLRATCYRYKRCQYDSIECFKLIAMMLKTAETQPNNNGINGK